MAESIKPKHIALIPDGNRRWAKKNGKGDAEGHRAGYETLLKVVDWALERGIRQLTVYAFSTENWQRTQEEVGQLIRLLQFGLNNQVKKYHERGIRVQFWGSLADLDNATRAALAAAEKQTENNTAATLNVCFNYGGRRDIIEGINTLLAGGADEVTEQSLSSSLSSHGSPDPDLIIRTSGERRLSNFLLWEGAYSELYFTDVLWPDVDEAEIDRALADYSSRKRRFGA